MMNCEDAMRSFNEADEHLRQMTKEREPVLKLVTKYEEEVREKQISYRKEEVKGEATLYESNALMRVANELKLSSSFGILESQKVEAEAKAEANAEDKAKAEAKAKAKKAEADKKFSEGDKMEDLAEAKMSQIRATLMASREDLEKAKILLSNARKAEEEAKAAEEDAKKKRVKALHTLTRATPCTFVGSVSQRTALMGFPNSFLEDNPNFCRAMEAYTFHLEYVKEGGTVIRCRGELDEVDGSWGIKAIPSWDLFFRASGGNTSKTNFRVNFNGEGACQLSIDI